MQINLLKIQYGMKHIILFTHQLFYRDKKQLAKDSLISTFSIEESGIKIDQLSLTNPIIIH